MLNAGSGGLPLSGSLEEELVEPADSQTLGQVIKGAVLVAAMVAVAVGFATAGEPLDEGGAQEIGADFDLGKEPSLAVAQGEGGFGAVVYPSHI